MQILRLQVGFTSNPKFGSTTFGGDVSDPHSFRTGSSWRLGRMGEGEEVILTRDEVAASTRRRSSNCFAKRELFLASLLRACST
jgi:hypothetical protein